MGKKENRKIQDFDGLYAFLRHYVDFMLRMAYRRIKYVGLEKVPADGAVIYAPNHTNALMDALVILAMDRKQKVFVARADIFRNPKVAKILRFLKIMPIMRIRDGMDEVRKNTEIIHKSVDVLLDKVPFCILPEGRHQAKHSLLPLSKGIFRIALEAEELMNGRLPLYIVPVGLEYGNFFRFRSTVLVQTGEPINVSAFLKEHRQLTQPEVMNLMKDELTERMKEVILYIPDDEYYDATLDTCAAVINQQVDSWRKEHPGSRRHSLTTRFAANKMTLGQIARLRAAEPGQAAELLGRAADIHREREKRGISLGSVVKKHPFWSRLLQLLVLIVTLPYTIPLHYSGRSADPARNRPFSLPLLEDEGQGFLQLHTLCSHSRALAPAAHHLRHCPVLHPPVGMGTGSVHRPHTRHRPVPGSLETAAAGRIRPAAALRPEAPPLHPGPASTVYGPSAQRRGASMIRPILPVGLGGCIGSLVLGLLATLGGYALARLIKFSCCFEIFCNFARELRYVSPWTFYLLFCPS